MTSWWSGVVPATVSAVGALRVPIDTALRHTVRALVAGSERAIVLDLARVSEVDAAGVGELARMYNIAAAAGGRLWIVNTMPRVRELLVRAGLFDLLTESLRAVRAGFR
jgi:anti-anti-sigma factor